MPGETLSFDILAHDGASRSFRDVGNEALKASGKVDIAAASLKVFDDATMKQGKAAATSTAAMKAHRDAANLLADAENVLAGRATTTTKLMADQGRKLDDGTSKMGRLGKATDETSGILSGFGRNAGGAVSPMGALVGAGAALAPVLVTLGFGLGGLAAAAYGVAKPIETAAQKAGGLRANLASLNPEQQQAAQSVLALQAGYDRFQKALEPTVLRDFNAAISVARPLLAGVEPVAKATGNALAGVFGQLGVEFRSGQWQQFFAWMAANAGPDLRQVGSLLVSLTKDIPPLMEELQPLAHGFLSVADAAAKAGGAYVSFLHAQQVKANQPGTIFTQIKDFIKYGYGGQKAAQAAQAMAAQQAALNQRLKDAHTATADLIHPVGTFTSGLQSAQVATQSEAAAVTGLTSALKVLAGGLLTTEQDQVAWKQAQQAAGKAIQSVTGSLDSNKAAALAARSAVISSTQAALTYANQEVNVHHNTQAASTIIRDQIRWLQDHAGKSRIAAAEIDALRQALAKLTSKKVTVTLQTAGGGTVKVSSSVKNAAGFLEFRKAGGLIGGGMAGRDSVPAMLMPGEVVVPTSMVKAGMVDHLRGRLPRFAGGGLVGELGTLTPFASAHERTFAADRERVFATAAISALLAHAQAVEKAAKLASMGSGGPSGGAVGALQRFAASLFGAHGWGPGQLPPLISLWNQESGWNRFARNPSSGAYGIPQALPPGKMGAAANPPTSSAAAQIRWGEGYIASVYGSPAAAWAHERAVSWYGKGLDAVFSKPTLIGVGEAGRERVRVTPAGLGAGGRGGNTYKITVNVPPNVNMADVGQATVTAIREFERTSGKGWRS